MNRKTLILCLAVLSAFCGWVTSGGEARAEPIEVPNSSRAAYRLIQDWIAEHGDTHVYRGDRPMDDFFCRRPLECRNSPAERPEESLDPLNPMMDRLAELADRFVELLFLESLGSEQDGWIGLTSRGERCEVDLVSFSLLAHVDGEPFRGHFRGDWNDEGSWTLFRVSKLTPDGLRMQTRTDWITRTIQRVLFFGQTEEQKFEIRRLDRDRLRITMKLREHPAQFFDWETRKVECEWRRTTAHPLARDAR